MFEFVRRHKRIMQFLLFLLIVPSFVLFGLDGYNRMREKSPVVARVGAHEITQAQWDLAHKQAVEQARQSMPSIDVALLETPQARYATLDRLVRARLLEEAVRRWHLFVADARLARELQNNPIIAGLRGTDGKLDIDRYRQLLALQGLSPDTFEAGVRADLAAQQVLRGVSDSELVVPRAADLALAAMFERREIELARFVPSMFREGLKPGVTELQAYYAAHQDRYKSPEQVDIEYLVLDADALRQRLTVSDADIEDYYRQNKSRYETPEERRVSHILIAVDPKADRPARDKAKARAIEVLQQVRQNPGRFAEFARKYSQDPGSASAGGDLGFFARGAMVRPFEEAAFALKRGEVSDIVETDFGFHIILLSDVRPGRVKDLAEVREQIAAELKKTLAQRRFAELAESFSNAVYEQPDGLGSIAERFHLKLERANGVERKPRAGQTGIVAEQKFLDALFRPESLEKKQNTEAIEVAPSRLVAGRVLRYEPARTRDFAEVRDEVAAQWLQDQAIALAKKEGERRLEALKANGTGIPLSERMVVSRDQTGGLPPAVVEAVMRLPRGELPHVVGVDLGPSGYVVARVTKVLAPTQRGDEQRQKDRQVWARAWTEAEIDAYLSALRSEFGVEILVPRPTEGQ